MDNSYEEGYLGGKSSKGKITSLSNIEKNEKVGKVGGGNPAISKDNMNDGYQLNWLKKIVNFFENR